MTEDQDNIKYHYDKMRELNLSLPEWDDAPQSLKDIHTKLYFQKLVPIINRIKEVINKGKQD